MVTTSQLQQWNMMLAMLLATTSWGRFYSFLFACNTLMNLN
jgi:hypothetical protein